MRGGEAFQSYVWATVFFAAVAVRASYKWHEARPCVFDYCLETGNVAVRSPPAAFRQPYT